MHSDVRISEYSGLATLAVIEGHWNQSKKLDRSKDFSPRKLMQSITTGRFSQVLVAVLRQISCREFLSGLPPPNNR